MKSLAMGLVVGLGWVAMGAQDTRTVTEPVIPKACVVLKAELAATPDGNGGRLREEDEGRLDTERIQSGDGYVCGGDGGGACKAVRGRMRF